MPYISKKLSNSYKGLVAKRYAVETENLCLCVSGFENVLNGSLAIAHLVCLLLQSLLLEEFSQATFSDVLNHLCGEVCSLLCRNGLQAR